MSVQFYPSIFFVGPPSLIAYKTSQENQLQYGMSTYIKRLFLTKIYLIWIVE